MDGALTHCPAEIVLQLLIDLGLVTDPESNAAWAGFENRMADAPDNAVRVSDTEGRLQGRTQTDGKMQGFHGLQFMVRGIDQQTARAKADAIAQALDVTVNRNLVTLDNVRYRVHAITRRGDTISLGEDRTNSRRRLFSINAIASIALA